MKATKRTTVLLAEDHVIVREGLRKLLDEESDIKVVGEAATGREAVDKALELGPAVIVMDIAMPHLNGLEATRQILRNIPDAKIIILSAYNDDAYVKKVTELGAKGYLVKQTSAHFLSQAIREVELGNTFFSPEIAKRIQHRQQTTLDRQGHLKEKNVVLSSRETEVLQLIAEGEANKQIAAELGISIKTVEKHRARVMQKLDIRDTAGLTRYAIAEGIIESSVQETAMPGKEQVN